MTPNCSNFTFIGYACLRCETANLAIQRAIQLSIHTIDRRRRRGQMPSEEALLILDILHRAKSVIYGCDGCNSHRIITHPSLNQFSNLVHVRVPRRVPDGLCQLVHEIGYLPSMFSNRHANFRY